MLVLRFLLMLGAITALVCLGLFLFTRDRRYLRLLWRVAQFVLVLLLVMAALFFMGRVLRI